MGGGPKLEKQRNKDYNIFRKYIPLSQLIALTYLASHCKANAACTFLSHHPSCTLTPLFNAMHCTIQCNTRSLTAVRIHLPMKCNTVLLLRANTQCPMPTTLMLYRQSLAAQLLTLLIALKQ